MDTVFIDESKTKGYTLVAVVVRSGEIRALRREVLTLRKAGQARVHMVKESNPRRRLILSTLCALHVRVHIYHADGLSDPQARAACLEAVIHDLSRTRARRIVLERDESIEQLDRRVLGQALHQGNIRHSVAFTHESASSEPLLWVADAVAWAFSRGGEWSARIGPMTEETRNLTC